MFFLYVLCKKRGKKYKEKEKKRKEKEQVEMGYESSGGVTSGSMYS